MTLQEIKNQIAKDQGFQDWETCFNQHILDAAVHELMDLLSTRYGIAKWDESLTMAGRLFTSGMIDYYSDAIDEAKKSFEP